LEKISTSVFDSYNQEIFENDTIQYKYCYNEKVHIGKVVLYKSVWLIEGTTDNCSPFLHSRAIREIKVL
jgi:hypothetical protein